MQAPCHPQHLGPHLGRGILIWKMRISDGFEISRENILALPKQRRRDPDALQLNLPALGRGVDLHPCPAQEGTVRGRIQSPGADLHVPYIPAIA